MPTYLNYKYIYFFHFDFRSDPNSNIFLAEPDPDPWKNMSDLHPCILRPNPDIKFW